jgi:LmbE family N-acetylglucosaminyl deacetylase
MPVVLREVEPATVLVVAPHMDDELIGPGGTLILHRDRGSKIHVVFCAGGTDEATDAVRKSEAREVAKRMGLEADFLGFPDGSLSPSEGALAKALASKLQTLRPNVVFCPFPADYHRDHTACAMALAEAVQTSRFEGEIWAFEVWSPLWPNTAVDISEVADEKGELIGLYASQTAGLHYVEGTLGLNRYRGLRVYVPYAEAFFVSRRREFCEVASMLNTV